MWKRACRFPGTLKVSGKPRYTKQVDVHLLMSTHEGFGEEGFDPKWPNGARIAVSFVLNYEYVAFLCSV